MNRSSGGIKISPHRMTVRTIGSPAGIKIAQTHISNGDWSMMDMTEKLSTSAYTNHINEVRGLFM